MASSAGVVIVGGGQAGYQTAESLRQLGYAGPVTLVAAEPHAPYQRPPLSKGYLLGEVEASRLGLRPDAFFSKHAIELLSGVRARALDRTQRVVHLDTGAQLAYDHLVLATGSRSRAFPVPGADLRNVFYLRTLHDAQALRAGLARAETAVVIGAGFIGLEFAASAVRQGLKVTVLERAERPMPRSVSRAMASVFRREHEKMGVVLRFGADVLRLRGERGCVTGVETAEGELLKADLVLVGVGAIPNSELAAESGLRTADGIVVDEFLRTSDPHVSAIGDVAAHVNPYAHAVPGQRIRLESVQNAADQARCVALRIAGRAAPYAALPWFWSHQGDLKLQTAGLPSSGDEEVLRGDPASGSCAVFVFREGRLVCVETLNRAADHMLARRLLAQAVPLTPTQAADASVDLKSLVTPAPGAAAAPRAPR